MFTVTVSPGLAGTSSSPAQMIAPLGIVVDVVDVVDVVVVVVVVVVVDVVDVVVVVVVVSVVVVVVSVVVVVVSVVVVVVSVVVVVVSVVVVVVSVVVVVVSVVVVVVSVDVVFGLTMIAPSTVTTYFWISVPFVSDMITSDITTLYVPPAQSSGTLYVSVRITPPSAAADAAPVPFANTNSVAVTLSLLTTSGPYAIFEPSTDWYAIGASALIMNCAPATGSLTALGSFTTRSIVTVSPGSAVTVVSCHTIAPAGTVVVVVVVVDVVVVVVVSVVVVVVSVVVVVVSVVVVVVSVVVVVVSVVVVVVSVVVVVVSVVVVVVSVVVVVVSVVVVVVIFLTWITPSSSVTFFVMSSPYVSLMNASDHTTG